MYVSMHAYINVYIQGFIKLEINESVYLCMDGSICMHVLCMYTNVYCHVTVYIINVT